MRVAIIILLLAVQWPLHAGELWRCQHTDGSVGFRDTPCPASSSVAGERVRYGSGQALSNGSFNAFEHVPPPEYPADEERPSRREVRSGAHDVRAAREAERRLRCAEAERDIAAVNRRLRRGYSAGEGNELRAERRRLESYMNDLCR